MRLFFKAVIVVLILGALPSYRWFDGATPCPSAPARYWSAALAGSQAAERMEARGEYLRAYDTREIAAKDQRIADAIEATRVKLGCAGS